jgi:hypothetical protein
MQIMLRRWPGLLVRIALLLVIAVGSNLWLVRIGDSVHNHRSVLTGQPSLNDPTNPLVQQVVVVLIGGLRYDASLEMPFLNTLREQGLDARCSGDYPSYSQGAWTTLISGAGPEISDAPLVNLPYEQLSFLTVDGLFTEAKRANLTTALVGFHWWERMIPEQVVDRRFFVSATDAQSDLQVTETALGLMSRLPPNLLLIHLSEVTGAAQAYGTDSHEYRSAVQNADSRLREIAQVMSLTRNVLIVTSDHGYLVDGGHGGGDTEVVITPLVIVGARVAPGSQDGIRQADIAPTVAALLGLAVPSAAQGDILFDSMVLDEAESTEKWVSWSQQRVELSSLYLESIGQEALTEAARGDAAIAYSSLMVRNYGSARRLAEFAVRESTKEMIKGRSQRIAGEQQRRLLLAVLPVAAVAYLLWRRWSATTAVLFACALSTVAIHSVLFLWQGHVCSFSTIGDWETFATDALVRTARAMVPAVCVITWLVWRQKRRSPIEIAALIYSFALMLALLIALPLAATYVLNGSEISWRLPHHFSAFLQVYSLLQLGLAAFLTILLPPISIPTDRALRWVSSRVGSRIRSAGH